MGVSESQYAASCVHGITGTKAEVVMSDLSSMNLLPMSGGDQRRCSTIAVVRHGERLDRVDPSGWYGSEDGKSYPSDPPLSRLGRRQAMQLGNEFACLDFNLVVSSPLIRSVATAVEICRALALPLCIDLGLGEVFNKAHFAPPSVLRKYEEVTRFVPKDVHLVNGIAAAGDAPKWPESSQQAQQRMLRRVEHYVCQSVQSDRSNCILVSHADCVASCAAELQAANCNELVKEVDFCSYVLLRCQGPSDGSQLRLLDKDPRWKIRCKGVHLRTLPKKVQANVSSECRATL